MAGGQTLSAVGLGARLLGARSEVRDLVTVGTERIICPSPFAFTWNEASRGLLRRITGSLQAPTFTLSSAQRLIGETVF
jgi:hypothetical protein